MAKSERRITPRFKLRIPLSFHRIQAFSEGEQLAQAINISTRGVYFMTDRMMCVGESLEVLLEMPKRVTGVKGATRRFVGRVSHVELQTTPQGQPGIGVQLLYYEHDLVDSAFGNE
jgi:hypothetical protein